MFFLVFAFRFCSFRCNTFFHLSVMFAHLSAVPMDTRSKFFTFKFLKMLYPLMDYRSYLSLKAS